MRAERTVPYRVLAEHLETFLDRTSQDPDRSGLPGFVEQELRRFLSCGILAHGSCRVHCVRRPAIATERLSLSRQGNVLYRLRRPWRDGTTHVAFEPLTLIERPVALIPRARAHLVTYHGVLAPAASGRDLIVPNPRAHRRSGERCSAASERRHPWADLLARVFAIDVLRCACGARRQLIALITESEPIRRILSHLGRAALPPPNAPAQPLTELAVDISLTLLHPCRAPTSGLAAWKRSLLRAPAPFLRRTVPPPLASPAYPRRRHPTFGPLSQPPPAVGRPPLNGLLVSSMGSRYLRQAA